MEGMLKDVTKQAKAMSKEDLDEARKMIESDERLKTLSKFLKKSTRTRSQQSQDPALCVKNVRGIVNPNELLKYPESPTAQRHLAVFQLYMTGIEGLDQYTKSSVDTKEDCMRLERPLQAYASGLLLESHMMKIYGLPLAARYELIGQYCKLRKDDWLVEFLKIMQYDLPQWKETLTPYECSKNEIIALERLVHKCIPFQEKESMQQLLHGVYHFLGSMYVTTDQDYRAEDVFKKALALKKNDLLAIYGLGFCSFSREQPVEAEKWLKKYLELAPRCDEKYPNAHYLLANVYMMIEPLKDLKMVEKYYKLGLDAEKYRLPFNSDDIPFKDTLKLLFSMKK